MCEFCDLQERVGDDVLGAYLIGEPHDGTITAADLAVLTRAQPFQLLAMRARGYADKSERLLALAELTRAKAIEAEIDRIVFKGVNEAAPTPSTNGKEDDIPETKAPPQPDAAPAEYPNLFVGVPVQSIVRRMQTDTASVHYTNVAALGTDAIGKMVYGLKKCGYGPEHIPAIMAALTENLAQAASTAAAEFEHKAVLQTVFGRRG